MVFPIFWLVSTSFRPAPELNFVPPPLLPDHWTLKNYLTVFDKAPMLLYFWNSLVFATVSTRVHRPDLDRRGLHLRQVPVPRANNLLFVLVLATAIVPFEIYMVPLFLQMNALQAGQHAARACSCRSWS